MKPFMDKDFLLTNETAQKLYNDYAKDTPILDYHCHISPQEIAEDRRFYNITQVWLGADHYKWRFMRSMGVEEKYITGDASDHDKFIAWAKCLSKAIGNPLYHWSHLELQRYFDIYDPVTEDNAEEIWTKANEKLKDSKMSARGLIEASNVTLLCTTDDPIDSLEYHEAIKNDASFNVKVLPAWRPDKAMSLEKPDYNEYIKKLENASGIKIDSFSHLIDALRNRLDFFESMGCVVSDHGLEYVMYSPAEEMELDNIFKARLKGEFPSREDELKFKTGFLLKMGEEYSKRNWVMQLHFGVKRDNNKKMFDKIGVDTGFDCISNYTPSAQLADFLNALNNCPYGLPKTILYSLNPIDNEAIGTIIGCFQDGSAVSKVQHGSAWWFNDNKTGMTNQLTSLANLGALAGFVGMLTDSRSFLSYTRHEYFRRILCNLLGTWVENGEYPEDYKLLGEMVKDISYYNAVRYFNFDL